MATHYKTFSLKDMKRYLLVWILIVGQIFMHGCGEDSTESVILGTWLGTSIVRQNCSDPLSNGAVVCDHDLSQCKSCMELVLNRDGTYSLSANFDSSLNYESGEYEGKNNVITLEPTDGEPYDLPISDVTETNMVIELQLSNGCTAVIVLKNSGC